MSDRMTHLLIKFLLQENGRLSKRASKKEFYDMPEASVEALEAAYQSIFHPDGC